MARVKTHKLSSDQIASVEKGLVTQIEKYST